MPLTRDYIDARFLRANRGVLEAIAAVTPATDQNALIGDAVEDALRRMGVAVATPGAIDDAALALVPERAVPYLLALAQVLLDEMMLGTVRAIVTEYDGPNRVEWSDMADGLEQTIARAWKNLDRQFPGGPDLTGAGFGRTVSGKMATGPLPPDSLATPWRAT